MPTRTPATRRVAALTATTLLASALGACATSTTSSAPGASSPTATSRAATAIVLDDGWVKAVVVGGPSMDSPSASPSTGGATSPMAGAGAMTAMFGTLRNTSTHPVTVTGGSSPVAARVELHETVKNDAGVMQMQPKQGGLTIPAGGTHVLQPGGDHVMLLGLTTALASGTTTTVTLSTSDGDVVLTVPVRSFAGAEESYVPTPSRS